MKFIHFGCWNNGLCDIELGTNGISLTMRKLKQYLEIHKDINFMTIAGDNYYPEKKLDKYGKKQKFLNIQNMISGINCLPKDITKFILLGNHEYDSLINSNGDELQCISIIKQKEEFSKNPLSIYFNDIMHKMYNNTLIIMLDTTIYEFIQDNIKLNPNDICYDEIFDDKSFNELINIVQYQEKQIKHIITSNNQCNNIIFVGHHPIFSIKKKEKEGEIIIKTEVLLGLIQLYKNIKDIIIDKNIYHLCADTHLYQMGCLHVDNKPYKSL
jgi:hypothetical protein